MNFDGYMNPMFSDMDNKYIYPMPYVNPMIYMNPYMMNQPNCQNTKKQPSTDNQADQLQNPYQNNPMMYMNPYMMNPMMSGGIDPNMLMQMYMQMMQMMQMMGCMPNMNPMGNPGMDNLMQDSMGGGYPDPSKQQMGGMPGMPNINIEEFDEEEM